MYIALRSSSLKYKKAQTTTKCGHIVEQQGLSLGKDLLHTAHVASYLWVGQVTVWRWCRDGTLPCIKIGREWRIRREALERFLEQSERSQTLVGRLRSFLEVPDNVLAIAQNREMMHGLDAAFFRVGET